MQIHSHNHVVISVFFNIFFPTTSFLGHTMITLSLLFSAAFSAFFFFYFETHSFHGTKPPPLSLIFINIVYLCHICFFFSCSLLFFFFYWNISFPWYKTTTALFHFRKHFVSSGQRRKTSQIPHFFHKNTSLFTVQ